MYTVQHYIQTVVAAAVVVVVWTQLATFTGQDDGGSSTTTIRHGKGKNVLVRSVAYYHFYGIHLVFRATFLAIFPLCLLSFLSQSWRCKKMSIKTYANIPSSFDSNDIKVNFQHGGRTHGRSVQVLFRTTTHQAGNRQENSLLELFLLGRRGRKRWEKNDILEMKVDHFCSSWNRYI